MHESSTHQQLSLERLENGSTIYLPRPRAPAQLVLPLVPVISQLPPPPPPPPAPVSGSGAGDVDVTNNKSKERRTIITQNMLRHRVANVIELKIKENFKHIYLLLSEYTPAEEVARGSNCTAADILHAQ